MQLSDKHNTTLLTRAPRILLVTRNLPPLLGGMERLNLHLARTLADWGELVVIGPEGCRPHLPEHAIVIEVPVQSLWRFLLYSFREARRQSIKHKFHLVIAGSGLTAPAALHASRVAGGKSAAYVHGLDLLVAHPIYRAFWRPALRRMDLALANSVSTADIARRLHVAHQRVEVLHPGVTLPAPEIRRNNDFRNRHKLGERPLLLSVGRLTARKGLVEFVRHALPLIVRGHPDALLIVVGDDALDALSDGKGAGKAAVTAAAKELNLLDNILFLGVCDDLELSRGYFAADVHVFPIRSLPNDVEGFGIVAIEAAAHGLPTVAFSVGGVPDAVISGKSGYLVEPKNYNQLAEKICLILNHRETSQFKNDCERFAASLTWETFGRCAQNILADFIGTKSELWKEFENP